MRHQLNADAASDAQRLRDRLRGVVLPEIARVRDLTELTGLPEPWFIPELESGRLPGIRLGSEWLIHRRSIEHWLSRQRFESGEVQRDFQ